MRRPKEKACFYFPSSDVDVVGSGLGRELKSNNGFNYKLTCLLTCQVSADGESVTDRDKTNDFFHFFPCLAEHFSVFYLAGCCFEKEQFV